jgi:GT2 family glycosyltransferase
MPALTASIIVTTYRRPRDLAVCLDSIPGQSVAPLEVIVVDNDPRQGAKATVGDYDARYRARGIALLYEPSPVNSPPRARNLGVRLSRGDVVLFLDDDVVLEKEYLRHLMAVYEEKPTAAGVQGYVTNYEEAPRFLRRVFYQYNVQPDACRVWPSLRVVYPWRPDKVMPCEWLAGCNASFRRSIAEEFPQDEELIRYSFGEDVDQALRVGRSHPNALWLTPFARCLHRVSASGRATGREPIYTAEVYGLYLHYKLFPPTLANRGIYWWSAFGRMVGRVNRLLRGEFAAFGHHLGAFLFCWRHWREIKTGRLAFFERAFEKGRENP